MFNAILIFVIVTVGLGLFMLRHMSSDERWSTIKYLSYSLSCGVIALVILAGIVFIF